MQKIEEILEQLEKRMREVSRKYEPESWPHQKLYSTLSDIQNDPVLQELYHHILPLTEQTDYMRPPFSFMGMRVEFGEWTEGIYKNRPSMGWTIQGSHRKTSLAFTEGKHFKSTLAQSIAHEYIMEISNNILRNFDKCKPQGRTAEPDEQSVANRGPEQLSL